VIEGKHKNGEICGNFLIPPLEEKKRNGEILGGKRICNTKKYVSF
jgi:hypothetical protein